MAVLKPRIDYLFIITESKLPKFEFWCTFSLVVGIVNWGVQKSIGKNLTLFLFFFHFKLKQKLDYLFSITESKLPKFEFWHTFSLASEASFVY